MSTTSFSHTNHQKKGAQVTMETAQIISQVLQQIFIPFVLTLTSVIEWWGETAISLKNLFVLKVN